MNPRIWSLASAAFTMSIALLPACSVDADRSPPTQGWSLRVALNGATTSPVTIAESGAVGNSGNGISTYPVTGTPGVVTQSDLDTASALKGRLGTVAVAATPSLGPTAETLTWVAAKAPNELVHFTLVLPELAFSWERLRGVTDSVRSTIIQERQADLAPVQQAVINKLVAIGGTDIQAMWLANLVNVTLPAAAAPQLASWPEVAQVEHDLPITPSGAVGDGYYGADRRIAIHADRLRSQGYTGLTGNAASPSSAVRLSDVGLATDQAGNNNYVPYAHPGFETGGVTFSRYSADDTCSATTLSCSAAPAPTAQTHDTVAMGVMAGSIEAGQDPSFPGTNTAAEADRSGIASAASLSYYRTGANSTQAAAIALQEAVNSGIDIVNNSYGTLWAGTDPTTDFSGTNEIIQSAFQSGMLVVFAAGDENMTAGTFSSSCNTTYPSNRPDVLAVNGDATSYTSSGGLTANPILLNDGWSTSGCAIDVLNIGGSFVARSDNAIASVAPGFVGLSYFWIGATNFGYSGNWLGSSFAAPIVTGAAGILRDAWQQAGFGIRPNYYLKTDLMMLTDGYQFTSYTDGGTNRSLFGTSQFSGPGRLQMRSPTGDFPNGAWRWEWATVYMGSGSTWSKSFSANISNYRFAMFWEETDLTKVADIDVRVDALNSAGTLCSSYVAYQLDYSIINVLHVKRSDIPSCALAGGSLQLTISTYAMPSGQTRSVYFSDLWDNEPNY